jgi:sugar fermentation stimulation protein A|tara:strand:- start:1821 stop:2552 length:732 start_codon:yes stop_codon:yes gene_type:complete
LNFSPPLASAVLIKRYKRFLADITLSDGSVKTIHCPNTGSMKNCAAAGDRVWYSTSENPKRKYAHTWELNETQAGHFIGVNTHRANTLVHAAIDNGVIAELQGYGTITPEVKYGQENSRIDLLLTHHQQLPSCYVEVKSVTLCEPRNDSNIGYFPDSVSARGTKHLRELMQVVDQGDRGVLVFCVQHSAIEAVRPALHIDPIYTATLTLAMAAGVEVMAYRADLSATGVRLVESIPVSLVELE